jgi:hypothetical protein
MKVSHLRCSNSFWRPDQTFRLWLHDWLPYGCTSGAEENPDDLSGLLPAAQPNACCLLPTASCPLSSASCLLPPPYRFENPPLAV